MDSSIPANRVSPFFIQGMSGVIFLIFVLFSIKNLVYFQQELLYAKSVNLIRRRFVRHLADLGLHCLGPVCGKKDLSLPIVCKQAMFGFLKRSHGILQEFHYNCL